MSIMKDKTFMKIVLGEILASAAVLGFLIASAVLVMPQTAGAQVQSTITVAPMGCTVITSNLYLGASDRFIAGNNVAKLQAFLISRGYLNASATGFYGMLTFSAVRNFQRDNNILAIGQAGPLTRSYIQRISCNGTIPPVTYAPTISSISPSAAAVGTIVNVYGTGFDSNTTVSFGGAFGPNVQVHNSNTLSFRIPERSLPACAYGNIICLIYGPAVEPGIYQISVKNNNGTSNSLTFTVTSTNPNPNPGNTPVINGIDSPSVLSVNQTGTWTIRATDTTGGGLSYRVVWGDEYQYSQNSAALASSGNFTQSATFSHSYSQTGVFTPRFYVRGSNGMTAEASVTVQVTNSNQTQNPSITYISPATGTYGTVVTVYGNGFTRYNNSINYAGRLSAVVGVESVNGTSLQFTVPATPCSSGSFCAQVVMEPGTYPISVTNQNGTSNNVNFTLTSSSGQPIDQTISAYLGNTVQVGTGSNSLTIRPVRIVEDSRCPVGVYCFQAGRVVVETNIQSGNSFRTVNLATGSYTGGAETQGTVVVEGYTIQITGVTPQARQGGINSNEYVISYRVTR